MNAESLNSKDLEKYTAKEVASLVDVDSYAVRDEGIRRQNSAEKKIEKLKKQMAKATLEMNDASLILTAFNNFTK